MIFLIITDQISCIYWLISDFYSLPLKFLWSIALRTSTRWTPLADTTDKQTDRQANKRLSVVRLCLRWSLSLWRGKSCLCWHAPWFLPEDGAI